MGSGMFDNSRHKLEAGMVNILEGRPDFEYSPLDSMQPKPPARSQVVGSVTITSRHW